MSDFFTRGIKALDVWCLEVEIVHSDKRIVGTLIETEIGLFSRPNNFDTVVQ